MAMDAYQLLGRQAVQTMGLGPLVLSAFPADLTPDQALGFVRRLVLLRESDERRAREQAQAEAHDG